MPTYEYACSACAHQWEQSQRITEPAIEVCPACTQSAAHRLISGGTNFILKGRGWYSDLYASPKASSSPSEKGDKPEKSEGAKAESKDDKSDKGGASSPAPATQPASADTSPSAPKPAPSTSSTAST